MKSIKSAIKSMNDIHRSPRYVALFLVAALLFVLTTLSVTGERLPGPVETAFFEALNSLPSFLVVVLYPLGQYGAVWMVPVAALVMMVFARKVRPGIYVFLAGIGAWLLTKPLKEWINRGRPEAFFAVNLHGPESFIGLGYPSGHAAVAAAMTTVIWPFVTPLMRKILVGLTAIVMISRVYTGGHFPLDVLGGAALGVMVGSVVVLAFGVPMKRINLDRVKEVLGSRGIKIKSIKPASVDARGSVPYFAKTNEGEMFVKFYGKEQFSADWMFRIMRYIRYRDLEDENPYLELKRSLEHEAFMAYVAKSLGVNTPKIYGIFKVDDYFWGMAQEKIKGVGLDSMSAGDINDQLLDDIWGQVKILHSHHASHRDLRTANVFIDADGHPNLIDFGFAESMASERSHSKDVANLLASFTTLIGPERAVASCSRVMGNKALIAAYPFLQYEVFSGATKTDLKKDKSQLKALRAEVAKTVGEKKVEGSHAKMKRISTASLVQIIALGLALFVLAPQFSDFSKSFSALVSVNPAWLAAIFGLAILTYFAAAFTLKSFSVYPMKWRDSTIVQLAASFTNRLLPSGVGGLALNVQFLRTRGHKVSEATSVLLMQRTMDFLGFSVSMILIVMFSQNKLSDIFDFNINAKLIAAVAVSLIALIAVLLSIDKLRTKVLDFIHKMVATVVKLATDPIVLTKSFVSSMIMNFAFLTALFFSLRAVGVDITFVESTLVFAGAAAASSVAPTPGGLGVVEAAMVASLVALGYSGDTALAGVLLYRLFTYWIPIPFGWLSYRYIINRKLI